VVSPDVVVPQVVLVLREQPEIEERLAMAVTLVQVEPLDPLVTQEA